MIDIRVGTALLSTILLFSYLLLYRLAAYTKTRAFLYPSLKSSHLFHVPSLNSEAPGQNQFCGTDPGLEHHILKNPNKTSRHTCFGSCKTQNNFTFHAESAVEAPHLLTLCQDNPFHGFYDCLYPLIHYLTTCRPDHPPVITRNGFVLEEKRKEWATSAQKIFLQHSGVSGRIVELADLGEDECICFQKVVKFPKKSFWRPTRFQYQQQFQGHNVLASHPGKLKENSLNAFRSTVLKHFQVDSTPHETDAPILVYDRKDAKRRRWLNAENFIKQLSTRLPKRIRIKHMTNMPREFKRQVLEHNQAGILIAPHGAGMVNTLFMREGSTVIELASRHCLRDTNMENETSLDVVMNISDANTWVPWHAHGIGLYHLAAPCVHERGYEDFVTSNDVLVNITLTALTFPRTPF